jgi:hypothetical protein
MIAIVDCLGYDRRRLCLHRLLAFVTALLAGALGMTSAAATPTTFTGSYSQNFDIALANSATAMPDGFRAMILSGANSTFTAANPISTTAIAAATASGPQTLTVWDFGSQLPGSGIALYNIGSMGNLNDRALGSDPTGVGAVVIELSLRNATGSNLLGVTFSYDCKCLRNGLNGTEAAELPGYAFFYSLTGGTNAVDWTPVNALSLPNYTQGTTLSSGAVAITFPTPLTNHGMMYFRWADDNTMACSPNQVLAVDNLTITTLPPTNSLALRTLQQIKTVFVIALENHDWTQDPQNSWVEQILGNPAAPYLNSLITPGNSNAAQVSYATKYYNVGQNVHPSEPSYIWSEAGTTFGVYTDDDPGTNSGNLFNAQHLTGQLNAAGIPWKSYQEDLEYTSSATVRSAGTRPSGTNIYNGSTEYDYSPKHNPMEFFTDTQNQNVYPLTQLWTDLANHAVGRYNWITPDAYNEMHSYLPGGFTYHGVLYTDDQSAIAAGDNCLSIIIPRIMASAAYQDHGVIILWMDETESTDDTNTTIPEIIISPLAKGNAYASSVVMSHSSDLRTMDEIFGLAFQTNAIPAADINASGTGYNYVAAAKDLSDLFQPIWQPPNFVGGEVNRGAGGVQLTFSGPAGQTYQVLASEDPIAPPSARTVVGTGTFGNTDVVFIDPDAANHPRRFYVIKSP